MTARLPIDGTPALSDYKPPDNLHRNARPHLPDRHQRAGAPRADAARARPRGAA